MRSNSAVRVTGAEYSRRFLRELDEAPGGNNLQYIYYSVLAFWFLYPLVTRVCTMKLRWEATGSTPESCVRDSLISPWFQSSYSQ